jgi:hypothetical protein
MRQAFSVAVLTAVLALLPAVLSSGSAQAQQSQADRFPIGGSFDNQPAPSQPYGKRLDSHPIGLGTAAPFGAAPKAAAVLPTSTNGGDTTVPAPAGAAPTPPPKGFFASLLPQWLSSDDASPPPPKGVFGTQWPGTIPFAAQKN